MKSVINVVRLDSRRFVLFSLFSSFSIRRIFFALDAYVLAVDYSFCILEARFIQIAGFASQFSLFFKTLIALCALHWRAGKKVVKIDTSIFSGKECFRRSDV